MQDTVDLTCNLGGGGGGEDSYETIQVIQVDGYKNI